MPFDPNLAYPAAQRLYMSDCSSPASGVLAFVWVGVAGNLKISAVSLFRANDADIVTFVTVKNAGPDTISAIDYTRIINPNPEQVSRLPYLTVKFMCFMVFGVSAAVDKRNCNQQLCGVPIASAWRRSLPCEPVIPQHLPG